MQAPKWRNVLNLHSSISQASGIASFHSTPASLAKWKNKWNSDAGRGQQPSKSYIRYATRQKRADAKKALKDLLYASGNISSKTSFQDVDPVWENDPKSWENKEDNSQGANKHSRAKKSSAKVSASRSSHAGKRHYNGGKPRRENFSFSYDFDENPETIFQATFGSRCYTWSFRPWEDSNFRHSSTGFEWRDQSNGTNDRRKTWDTTSETDEDDNSFVVGSCSDRAILGLPTSGPLKMEDVKSAFRLSALKWHPDKHQGPSQAKAEEKFKQCVDAYKSLCNALSSA